MKTEPIRKSETDSRSHQEAISDSGLGPAELESWRDSKGPLLSMVAEFHLEASFKATAGGYAIPEAMAGADLSIGDRFRPFPVWIEPFFS